MTDRTHRLELDELMRLMAVIGFVALMTWVTASSIGVISGYVAVSPSATLRFLLAVLILVFARRTYWEIREWRWAKISPDERFGFSNPLWEHRRSSELGFGGEEEHTPADTDTAQKAAAAVNGSQHPRA
jgi:hypothetical protein